MVILIDTNIVMDVLTNREPFSENARKIMEKCAEGTVTGVLAAHSIPNLFYILRKDFSSEERRELLKNLCMLFQISDLNKRKIQAALENDVFSDFEDSLQEECAVAETTDYLVTRNPADFQNSRIKILQPEQMLELLEELE